MSHYREVVIETFKNRGEASGSSVRARPVSGQGLDSGMKVECSSKMRKGHPVGTKFLLQAKFANREGGPSFLYAHYNSPYRVLSDSEAAQFIDGTKV